MEELKLITAADAKSPVAEAYRTVRTNIQFARAANAKLKLITVTSATPNEGKSTVAANLAIVMAQAGERVLLIDGDLRNPTQHKLFKLSKVGLTNYLANGGNIYDYIVDPNCGGVQVMAAGPIPPNPADLLQSSTFLQMLEQLRDSYDCILIDTPPVLPVPDASILGSKVDGTLMVVESDRNGVELEREAKQRLSQAGAHVLGGIVNKVDIVHGKYGYGYGYGYYYYYGEDGEKEKRHKKQ